MKKLTIIIFDSGIGGLPYLKALTALSMKAHFIYVADSLNFPYGTKSADELDQILSNLASHLDRQYKPDALIIACNTATLNGIHLFRDILRIPVFGTQPELQYAVSVSHNKRVGVLATQASLSSETFIKEQASLISQAEIIALPAPDLVNFVEKDLIYSTPVAIDQILRPYIENVKNLQLDTLVLGCTHFIHLKQAIQERLPAVQLIDSSLRIANAVKAGLPYDQEEKPDHLLIGDFYQTSSKDETIYRQMAERFHLSYRGLLQ